MINLGIDALMGLSSGLSVNEICNLKIKDFNSGYDPQTGITILKLRREKNNHDFVTFLSPEASRAVKKLEHRERSTKKRKKISRVNRLQKQK